MAELKDIRLMGTNKELVDRLNDNFNNINSNKVERELRTGSDKDYKVLSDNNFTDAQKEKLSQAVIDSELSSTVDDINQRIDEKVNIADIVDNLESTASNKPVSANQAYILHGMIKAINTLLQSDEADLDTLQEVVNYIQNNKSLIDGITTTKVNIADIIDNLDSQDPKKPLSANQGYVLNSFIEDLNTALALLEGDLENKIDKLDIVDDTTTYETDKVPSANAVSKMHDELAARFVDVEAVVYPFTADDEHWSSEPNGDGYWSLTFIPTGAECVVNVLDSEGNVLFLNASYHNNVLTVQALEKFEGTLVTVPCKFMKEA